MGGKTRKVQVSFWVVPEVKRKIRQLAREQNMTVSMFMGRVVQVWLLGGSPEQLDFVRWVMSGLNRS